MLDSGIEAVTRYEEIACYGPLWLVEFRDYSTALVIEDPVDCPDANHVLRVVEDNQRNARNRALLNTR